VGEETRTFLRDCFDHTLQLVDLLETYHETCTDLRDIYLSTVSNRLNEIMKVLTIIATIFIPLSFIASLYGMNFNTNASPWNMPELNWVFGYPFAIAVMLLVTTALLVYFYTRGWLGRPRERRDDAP
jgi:magnesium transporter